jgi:hypothetical protein
MSDSKKLLCRNHLWIDFTGRTGIRFRDQNRMAIDPDWFLIRDHDRDCIFKIGIRLRNENRGSILRSISLIDFPTKIGIRFHVPSALAVPEPVFNRRSILRSKSMIDFPMKIGIRLRNENRLRIFPERFSIAIVIAIAVLKSAHVCEMMLCRNHLKLS